MGNRVPPGVDREMEGAEGLLAKPVVLANRRGQPTRLFDDFKRANRAPGIMGMDRSSGLGVEFAESGVEQFRVAGRSSSLGFRLEPSAQFGRRGSRGDQPV